MKFERLKKCVIFFLFTSLISIQIGFGQDYSEHSIEYYLDDSEEVTKSRSIIKINLLSIVTGDLPLFYERSLSNDNSIELGVGVLLPYYRKEITQFFSVYPVDVYYPNLGYSWWVHPKHYLGNSALMDGYLGFQIRNRRYNLPRRSFSFTDITIDYGVQKTIGSRLVVDVNGGLGLRYKSLLNSQNKFEVVIPFAIKVGIIL